MSGLGMQLLEQNCELSTGDDAGQIGYIGIVEVRAQSEKQK